MAFCRQAMRVAPRNGAKGEMLYFHRLAASNLLLLTESVVSLALGAIEQVPEALVRHLAVVCGA